ncbi:DedA family protein [Rhizobium rhizosphaerae]|uniref:DedA family protein n=1 Tax=Xaviernesmea rhizosphaerae TaxID=1672749 RepID=A0ABX3PHZ5_9HYPH|nr:DedA family protein [Xaviernesmea rhizosphaerae]OQP87766.1 DedA family protein [Xaviernesmea rhizosphaerae]
MLEHWIVDYGALAIFLGAALEGETAAFLGGVLAHRHLLPYWQVAVAACLGSFLADQAFFFAGRYAANWRIVQRALQSRALQRVSRLLEAHPTGFVLSFRFIYGMRTISPLVIGTTRIPALRFLLLNAIAALVWGILITAIGFLFSETVHALFGRMRLHAHLLVAIGALALLIPALWLVVRHWRRPDPAS